MFFSRNKWFRLVIPLLVLASPTFCVERDDVLFFVPSEHTVEPVITRGTGTVSGTPRFGPGKRGTAVIVDAQAPLRYRAAGNILPDEGTIMMWVCSESASAENVRRDFFRAADADAINTISLSVETGRKRLTFYTSCASDASGGKRYTRTSWDGLNLEPDRWVQLAATWSSTVAATKMTLYVDGKRVTQADGGVYVPEPMPVHFELGGPAGTGTTIFDDVLVFQRPLTPREIREIHAAYADQKPRDAVDLPFTSRPELQLTPYPLPGRGEFMLDIDFRGILKSLGGQDVHVQALLRCGGKELPAQAPGLGGLARVAFDYNSVVPGPATASATLCAADGTRIRTGNITFQLSAKPIWLGNSLGRSDEVLPPWTPLATTGDTIEMWGRRCTCQGSPLPTQVVTQDKELLRGPIRFTVSHGESSTLLANQSGDSMANDGAAATRHWAGTFGPFTSKVTSRVEFDGFMRIDMELAPTDTTTVTDLTLVMPLHHDTGTLYHHANTSWSNLSEAGVVGSQGWRKTLPFVPYVWLGFDRGGVAWFCEHSCNWRNANAAKAIEIIHGPDGVDLLLHFVDQPTTMTAPFRVTFGFMATPVKPMPAGWRDWHQTFISQPDIGSFARTAFRSPRGRNIGALNWNHVGGFSCTARN